MAARHIRMKWAKKFHVKNSSLRKSSDIFTTKHKHLAQYCSAFVTAVK